jgi:hypothetical protein
VKVGLPNQLAKRENVKPMTDLPHDSKPVVAFLGATVDSKHAQFLVSRQVTSVVGGSSCSPARGDCEVLTMRPGGKAKLAYAPDGKTYVLKLLAIRWVPVRKAGARTGRSSETHPAAHPRHRAARSLGFASFLGG